MNALETYHVKNEKDGEVFELNILVLLSLTPAATRSKEKVLCTLQVSIHVTTKQSEIRNDGFILN
jgi:hypothetical protein